MNLHRLLDRIEEWWRYPQPTTVQKQLLGLYTDVIDTEFTAVRLASEESARYVLEHMRAVPNFDTDYDLHEWVCKTQLANHLGLRGMVLEFGVATGRTLNQFAYWLPHKIVHGFDGFKGLPEDWTSRMRKGFFARSKLPRVRGNCELHVGWFDQTLPSFVQEQGPRPVQLLHVDCDLYSSTVTILDNLKNNIVPGTVIIFDEYMNYPGWQLDEFRAWQEFVAQHKIRYEYIGRVSRHQKVAIRVLG
jgi:Macrocin-O-methyltransferase (TylF)